MELKTIDLKPKRLTHAVYFFVACGLSWLAAGMFFQLAWVCAGRFHAQSDSIYGTLYFAAAILGVVVLAGLVGVGVECFHEGHSFVKRYRAIRAQDRKALADAKKLNAPEPIYREQK